MMTPLRIFIGFDSREPVAYHVLSHSILKRASRPVSITPLARTMLQFHTRALGNESTEFSFTRFLVPYLSGYEGYSIYMDCDMLVRMDIHQVLDELTNADKAVWACQHDYVPKTEKKFLGQVQTQYPRKNWSSFLVFNNDACSVLTPEYVNTSSGMELHRFLWTEDEKIGALPLDYNWLVGEYDKNPAAKILHYTLGGPYFSEYEDCDHADLWWQEYREMRKPR
jgi:hypothetical protein